MDIVITVTPEISAHVLYIRQLLRQEGYDCSKRADLADAEKAAWAAFDWLEVFIAPDDHSELFARMKAAGLEHFPPEGIEGTALGEAGVMAAVVASVNKYS